MGAGAGARAKVGVEVAVEVRVVVEVVVGARVGLLRIVISEGLIRMVIYVVMSFSFYIFRTSAFQERMSVIVLIDLGWYIIFKWNSASWSAHHACLRLSNHLVVKYLSALWSVMTRKGVLCKLIRRGLYSARPRMTASISLSWIS